jgi:hypothetical protein
MCDTEDSGHYFFTRNERGNPESFTYKLFILK